FVDLLVHKQGPSYDQCLPVVGDHIQSMSSHDRSSIFFLKVKGLSFSITKEGGCGGVVIIWCGGHL
ncbi:hypothetical protein DPMN_019528, partial [Dreissena polymorpha]